MAASSSIPPWAADAIPPRVGYLSRKALPIKRNDAEPLTREDVQFDLLRYLFADTRAVFTSPTSNAEAKMTFSDLYVSALYTSNKCSKVLKEKMSETPAFGIEFAKIALLTNVGRINTTMAFFPEMKTALRTYHPVPSLQKTDGNAQDAPRIKNCLKAAVLPSEQKIAPPSTPEEVLGKLRAGQRPSTSVVNIIFVLANHAAPLSSVHFDGSLNFLDLFLPNTRFASASRGKAFLWLLYHYLEDEKSPNPFDDSHSREHPNKIPFLRQLSTAEYQKENLDTQEEITWGNMMSNQRNLFLQRLVSTTEVDKKGKTSAPHFVTETGNNLPRSQRQLQEAPKDERSFLFYVPSRESQAPRPQESKHAYDPQNHYPQPHPQHPYTSHTHRQQHQYGHRPTTSEGYQRSLFQQAWHLASVDPLLDSDDEVVDQHSRADYTRRLRVISRIRRRATTPP